MDRDSADVQTVDHLIVGAGFAGLCAAIKLQEDGETDFVVLEKGADVGGTWRDNTYPGATCDVPSQLYSFSFAGYDWPNSYSPQPDIQAYIKRVADESGTLDRFVFDTAVEDAAWDDEAQRWPVPHLGRCLVSTVPHRRRRRALRAQAARDRRDRDLPGRGVPLRAVGPRRRPDRQAGGGHRHRRLGDPDRPRAAEGRGPPRRLPAHRAVDHPAQRPALRQARADRAAPGAGPADGSTAPGSTGPTRPTCRRSPSQPKIAAPARQGRPRQHRRRASRTPSCATKVTPNFDVRVQAGAALQRLLPRPRRRQHRAGHRPDRQGHRQRDRHRGRRRARDRRAGRGDRLLHDRAPDHRARHRPHRADAGRPLARDRHGGLQGHHGPRVPEPVPAGRAQHRPGPHQHDLHHRVAGRLPARRDPRRCASEGLASIEPTQADTDGLEPQPAEADGSHRVDHRRLPELVPRRARPQHHAVAAVHRRLPAPAGVVRRRRLPGDSPDGGGA